MLPSLVAPVNETSKASWLRHSENWTHPSPFSPSDNFCNNNSPLPLFLVSIHPCNHTRPWFIILFSPLNCYKMGLEVTRILGRAQILKNTGNLHNPFHSLRKRGIWDAPFMVMQTAQPHDSVRVLVQRTENDVWDLKMELFHFYCYCLFSDLQQQVESAGSSRQFYSILLILFYCNFLS